MSEPAAEDLYPWLPVERVRSWLKLIDGDEEDSSSDGVDDVRAAAADWVEQQRKDLFVDVDDVKVFQPGPAVVQAAVLAAARLWSRKGSPAGLAAFAEFGAAEVLRSDPDVTRLLRSGLRPRVG